MPDDLHRALAARLLAMGDDELILGHRDSEWCGHAPILEEDIAFANIALDEIGHAMVWYQLAAQASGEDPDTLPNRLAYERKAAEWRNVRMVELPRGDWAFSMLRQYLFDAYETVMLDRLCESQHDLLAGAAAKIRKEEFYHFRHTSAWVRRLGLGTDESHQRMQAALDVLWPKAQSLFIPLQGDELLAEAWIVPRLSDIQPIWKNRVSAWLNDAGLELPQSTTISETRTEHSEHLSQLLDNLQEVTRLYPNQRW